MGSYVVPERLFLGIFRRRRPPGSGIFRAGTRSRRFGGTKDAVEHFSEGGGELPPEAPLEGGVVLRAAEEIGDHGAKSRAASNELDQAGGDGASQEASVIEVAGDASGNLQIG